MERLDSESRLDQIAASILEGTPVDWSAVESTADPDEQVVIRQLRVLAEVTALHRGPAPDATAVVRPDNQHRAGADVGAPAPPGTGRARQLRRGLPRLGHASRSRGRPQAAPGHARRRRSVDDASAIPPASSTRVACWPASATRTSSPCTAPRPATAPSGSGWSSSAARRCTGWWSSRAAWGHARRPRSAPTCAARWRRSTPRRSCTATSRRATSCARMAGAWC